MGRGAALLLAAHAELRRRGPGEGIQGENDRADPFFNFIFTTTSMFWLKFPCGINRDKIFPCVVAGFIQNP